MLFFDHGLRACLDLESSAFHGAQKKNVVDGSLSGAVHDYFCTEWKYFYE